MTEKWAEGVSLYVNAGPEDGIAYYDIWHNGGPGGPMLVAFSERAAREICFAIQELHELRAEVEYLRGERAAVVAWLREEAEPSPQSFTVRGKEWAKRIDDVADTIERGEHRREEEP